ncbi:hypothetical protein ACCO45_003302 [Purpureocillium lilacinum]|uniref:Uncharacterized protein n=1 Tax=Purpureocillium lilacinum TaxID=33203 RepID=A0ACC4E0W5_PURLI
MASDNATDPPITITARCLCKAHSVTASLPASSLPLEGTYCHCTSCRHMTGALHSSSVKWPGDPAAVRALRLREYDFSPRLKILFCGACGSPMFWGDGDEAPQLEPGAASGNGDGGFEAFMGVLSNNDVSGGGGCSASRTISLWAIPLTAARRSGCAICWATLLPPAVARSRTGPPLQAAPESVPVHCRCRGVDLVLRRGAAAADFSALKDASQLPFFVEPATHKLLASFDACDSCRTSFGTDVINWTFALLKHIDFAPSTSTSTSTASSTSTSPFPDSSLDLKAAVSRYFCSRCSASVFYAVDDRPDMVDLAGARAESVLSWALGDMGWADDMKGGWREELGASIKTNAENWRIKSGIPVPWIRKLREEREAQKKAAAEAALIEGKA